MNFKKIIAGASVIGGIAGIGIALSIRWAFHHKLKIVLVLLKSFLLEKLIGKKLMKSEE